MNCVIFTVDFNCQLRRNIQVYTGQCSMIQRPGDGHEEQGISVRPNEITIVVEDCDGP